MQISRRRFTGTLAGALAMPFIGGRAAFAADKVVRIGYQKYGTLVLLKGKGLLEAKLETIGYKVEWTEFPAGPQLLEALNAGAVHFGENYVQELMQKIEENGRLDEPRPIRWHMIGHLQKNKVST